MTELSESMIKVVDLYKSFGPKKVLQGADLEISKGESMVVLGGSGTGKSVLIKCIIGILRPDGGKVYVSGQEVTSLREWELNEVRKKFGMLFQGGALFDSLSVWENVGFGLKQHTRLSDKEIKERAVEKLKLVGLFNVENLRTSELSGGMMKRVSLARAICMEPEILLYDEPTTGLDPIMADVINELIIHLKKTLKVTSIAITHDMVSAYKIADKIAMLYKGKIIEVGTPDEIKSSKNEVVQQFIHGRAEGPITAESNKI
ncbi:MAG TPA: ABC transporter ATP-binding protein [Thermodesulfobacteriota bacterium]|nr:ABC transporter ATP-binding protein [Thermodesulfobacteriota bacterium]